MKKILIVEDETLIREFIHKSISRNEIIDVTSTGKGSEAIKLIKNNNFCFIFCDVMLEDITGFDIYDEVFSYPSLENPQKKFIFMTAYTSEKILNKINSLNCRLIRKPFSSIEDFIKIIEQK